MAEVDENIVVETEDVAVNAHSVTVNTGWTTQMAKWNTIGTVAGALVGLASLLVSGVALWVAFHGGKF